MPTRPRQSSLRADAAIVMGAWSLITGRIFNYLCEWVHGHGVRGGELFSSPFPPSPAALYSYSFFPHRMACVGLQGFRCGSIEYYYYNKLQTTS